MSISKRKTVKNTSRKTVKDEILRPRTAYNFFYRYQRDLILKSKSTSSSMNQEGRANDLVVDHSVKLSNTLRKRRPHRKTHGLIGLQELTKTVAKRWKEADTETRNKFAALAEQDKIRYKNENLSRSMIWMQPIGDMTHGKTKISCMEKYAQAQHSDVPLRIQSANVDNFAYCHDPTNKSSNFERKEIVPDHQGSSNFVTYQENILSAEEYDMLELLIQE